LTRATCLRHCSYSNETRQRTSPTLLRHAEYYVKYKTFIMGNNITCTVYCNHRIAATLYPTAGLLNLLYDAVNIGKIWSACGQYEFKYTE
jgi:hypothetical protein